MKTLCSIVAIACLGLGIAGTPACGQSNAAPAPLTLPVWPVGYLAASPNQTPEHDTTTAKDALVGGKRVIRLADVSNPTMTVYWPDPAKANGTAVVVLPGGGYQILAMDLEGTEISQWLNSIGVTAIVLKYRVPTTTPYSAPFQDVQRTLRIVRAHAQEWKIDSNHIGVMGFSAGGNLVARLSSNYETREYAPIDSLDQISCRPDFAILIYPAYLVNKDSSTLAANLHVTSTTPPSFLVQAEDDPVGVMNSIGYYLALTQNKVPAEMHIYARGGHGYGLRPSDNHISTWPVALKGWLQSIGMVAR